jgi:hypothetical protein
VIVAALGNGNDAVGVTDIVDDRSRVDPAIAHGVGYDHDVVPVPERGHGHGDRTRSRRR